MTAVDVQTQEVLLAALLDPTRSGGADELTINTPLAPPVLKAVLRLLTDRSAEPWESPNTGTGWVDYTGTLPCGLRLRLVQEAPLVGAGDTR